jgi:hypothetical protein
MRWKRVIVIVLMGGGLSFGGQLLVDFFCWKAPYNGETPYDLCCGLELDRRMAAHYPVSPERESYRNGLIYQGEFIWWLLHRGDAVCRTTLFMAFLGALCAVTWQRGGKNSTFKPAGSTTAGEAFIELEESLEQAEGRRDPVRVEMTAAGEILKSVPAKDRVDSV